MKTRVICLSPSRVTPGMVLAAPIAGREGHDLLPAGALLDAEVIDKLIRRGIETLSVGVPDTRDEATIAEEIKRAQARVGFIFRGNGSAAREALHALLLDYRREHTA